MSSLIVHETAVVSSKAEIGKNVVIDPYAVIKDDVHIGDNTYIGPHAVLYDGTRIGNDCRIYGGAKVACWPQDPKYKDEPTLASVGDGTYLMDDVTVSKGTSSDGGETKIGKRNLIRISSHIAHDAVVGDDCSISNCVHVGGHCKVGDWATLGGMTGIHQFVSIGCHSMVGGGCLLTGDVPPYALVARKGEIKFFGINAVGLKRRNFSPEVMKLIKEAYQLIYDKSLTRAQALEELKSTLPDFAEKEIILDFFTSESKRNIVKPL